MSRLFGGARLRSRTLKTLVVLGALLALASIMVGSASAAFPFPNTISPQGYNTHGWYVASQVSGDVDFVVADPDHQMIKDIICRQSSDNSVVGHYSDLSFSNPTVVPVTVFGDSPSPSGTTVTCQGTLLQEQQSCFFFACFYNGQYEEAGPLAETLATLHIDNSHPNVTIAASASPNANGWYNAPATVSFSGSDPNSGIFHCENGGNFGPGGSIGPPDGSAKAILGGCVNFAGIAFQRALVYFFDGTKPTISAAATTVPNSNGWYYGSVDVKFTCHDNLSGVVSCPGDQILSSEGAAVASTAQTTTDKADNVSNPSNTVEVKIDKTAPSVSVTGVTDGAVYGSAPTPACSTSDALSGVATDATLALSYGPLGSVTATCSGGTDLADNQAAPVSVSYSVGTPLTTKTQAMAGDLKVAQGSTLSAGYDFTMPGSHPAATVGFLGTTVTFNATCASGTPGSQPIAVYIDDQGYDDPANSSAWYPSGDQNDDSTYQGSTTVPSFCDPGALVRLQQGGTFSTYVTSTAQNKVNLRWHYKDGKVSGWSGTYSVIPN